MTIEAAKIISLHSVSKKFKLYDRNVNRIKELLNPFGKSYHEEFYAVNNISLNINQGQTIGIVGLNGSGKSTLLQMIAGLLKPTSGKIEVRAKRVSALLELGAGFNPILTGRENIYIHGALMGFAHHEIAERIGAIQEFADIGKFFDQPVKFYSSGMFVRLAFSAAINVNPEILIIDEAISVGDAKFQHKCYEKFNEFRQKGVTIIFVSHDVGAVVRNCDYALLIDKGRIIQEGNPDEVINSYLEISLADKSGAMLVKENKVEVLNDLKQQISTFKQFILNKSLDKQIYLRSSYNQNERRCGDGRAEVIDYFISNEAQNECTSIVAGTNFSIYLKAFFYEEILFPVFGFSIKTIDGVIVYATNTRIANISLLPAEAGSIITCCFELNAPLKEGEYFIDLGIAEGSPEILMDMRYSVIHISIAPSKILFDGLIDLRAKISPIYSN